VTGEVGGIGTTISRSSVHSANMQKVDNPDKAQGERRRPTPQSAERKCKSKSPRSKGQLHLLTPQCID
jgi:hypothetical protein